MWELRRTKMTRSCKQPLLECVCVGFRYGFFFFFTFEEKQRTTVSFFPSGFFFWSVLLLTTFVQKHQTGSASCLSWWWKIWWCYGSLIILWIWFILKHSLRLCKHSLRARFLRHIQTELPCRRARQPTLTLPWRAGTHKRELGCCECH